jgi:hypothetical protein
MKSAWKYFLSEQSRQDEAQQTENIMSPIQSHGKLFRWQLFSPFYCSLALSNQASPNFCIGSGGYISILNRLFNQGSSTKRAYKVDSSSIFCLSSVTTSC